MSSIFGVGSGSASSLLQAFFKAADTDKSGSLDLSEFKAIRQNVPSNTSITAESMFAAVDSNSDGAMTEGEIASFLQKYAPPSGLLQVQENGSSSSLMDKFKAADTDGDGKLSLDEFKAGFASRSRRHHNYSSSDSSSTDKAKQRFDALDTNGDGQISPDELSAGIAKNPNSSTGLFALLLQATTAYSSSSTTTNTLAAALQTA